MFPLKRKFNTIIFLMFLYPHFLKDEYVTEELLIEEMYLSNNIQRMEGVPDGVFIKTWVRAVQEAGFVLGKTKTRTATSPRARSRYVLQPKLLALDMKAITKDANVHVLIADVPKVEQNRIMTKKHIPFSVHLMVYPVAQRRSVLPRSGGTSAPTSTQDRSEERRV